MALTTATVADQITNDQPGNLGRLRTKRVIITFTSGYDSTTGVTLNATACGLAQILAVLPEGPANTGAGIGTVVGATGNAVVTLWDGTTKVATSDQSATTAAVLVLGH